MIHIGDIVQAKRGEDDYFFGVVVESNRPKEGRPQYRVRAIRPITAPTITPNECWVEELTTYDALRAWAGPLDWIEEWIGSR